MTPEPIPGAAGEIWAIRRPLYMADLLKAFETLGFPTRMVERAEAERAGLDGPAPAFVLDCIVGDDTFRTLNARGIPYVWWPMDQWYHATRQKLSVDQMKVCKRLGLPLVVTPLDCAFPLRPGVPPGTPYRGKAYTFTCGPEQVEPYRAAGLPHAEFLPFGVDPDRFRPLILTEEDRRRFGSDVSFVGTPLTADPWDGYVLVKNALSKARSGAEHPHDADVFRRMALVLEEAMEEQGRDLWRFRLPEILSDLERKHRVSFVFPPSMEVEKETWAILIGIHAAMLQRVEAVRRLSPLGLAVWGPSAWRDTGIPGLDYRGEAGWETDLPKVLNASAVNVNVSKLLFDTGVGPRVFEVLSCGGFLLSNRISAIADMFEEGKDLVFYDSLDDLEAKARLWLARPEERAEIGARARRKILERHTWLHRARRILAVLEADGALRVSSRP